MALTTVVQHRTTSGRIRQRIVDVTFDNSYTTNGKAWAPSDVELSTIYAVICVGGGPLGTDTNLEARYDLTTGKLKLWAAAGTEVANGSDQSLNTLRLLVFGV